MYHKLYYSLSQTKIQGEGGNHTPGSRTLKKLGSSKVKTRNSTFKTRNSKQSNTPSTLAGAAADKAASNKKTKYSALQQTHLFVPVSVEIMGSWNADSIKFVSTIYRQDTD